MSKKDQDIVKKAHALFKKCNESESANISAWKADVRFANADPDNGDQWDEKLAKSRAADSLPCLTINKVKQHNLQITNDAKKNRASPKVIPVDGGADKDTAEIFNGIIRHIEAQSCADIAYSTAFEFAVDGGLGYWRITTDYADDVSNDQEIYIEQIENPLNVFLYGNKKSDGSDALGGFIFEDMDKDIFEEKYPRAKALKGTTWEAIGDGWRETESIRVCEWFQVKTVTYSLVDQGNGELVLLSLPQDSDPAEEEDTEHKIIRKVERRQVKWYLIAGDEVLDSKDWPGKYVPIVRVVGEERIIDGKVTRKGHTRGMKDAQRMYNYWTSSAAAFVSAQGKTPWVAAAESIAGYEEFWDAADKTTHSYLPFNHIDQEGNPLPAPQKTQPPTMAQAYIQGMQIASDEMQAASGQYDAQLGENANQQSGRALQSLQRKGDNATYHFTDSADNARRYTTMILIDLIPKVYDTPKVARMLGEDGTDDTAELDPEQQQASIEREDKLTGEIKKIYNLNVGRYDVIAASGANYATKRAEAADGMIAMLQANPNLWQTHGDIIARSQDWPFADEFAERSRKTLPPGLADEEEGQKQLPPEVMQQMDQMQQQVQQLDAVIQKMSVELESKELDRYKAETDRLKVVMPILSPAQQQAVTLQALDDLQTPNTIAEEQEMQQGLMGMGQPQMPGMEQPQEDMPQPEPQPDPMAMALMAISQALENVAMLAEKAGRPRRSQLEYDADGNPIASISSIINE